MHDFLFYINVIISYSFKNLQTKTNTVWSWKYWWLPSFYLCHCNCDWLNHSTWFHSNRALPRSMEFESMSLHLFYTLQTPISYVGCLMITNTWRYICLYFRNTAILVNKKNSLWTLVTFTFTPRKLCKMWADSW